MSIRDQDIMVLHRTIPNPMVTRAQAIPNPMGIRAQAITTVPHHTIPNPMGIRAPVGKWLPVIAETVATESKGRFRFRTFGCSLEQQPMQDPTDLLEWRESKNTHYPQIYPHKTAKY